MPLLDKSWFLALSLAGLIAGALIFSVSMRAADRSFLCSLPLRSIAADPAPTQTQLAADPAPTQTQLAAVLHYATTKTVPQQTLSEIRITFDVLGSSAPCNFLVFGLGHDSLMWASFNPRGTTVFLEEDPVWVREILKTSPGLQAHTVKYRTKRSQSDNLLRSYRSDPACVSRNATLRGSKCRLALADLPAEIYEREWDLIMIDAPRGYFDEAPGRMAAIYSAAIMARNRKKEGATHVFLHDVDRRVEKVYAEEFLCRKNLVDSVGRLWHFKIPASDGNSDGLFC